jgi:hypothetical protein
VEMKDVVVVVVGARRDAGAPQTGPGPRVQGLGVQSRYAVAQAAKGEESMRNKRRIGEGALLRHQGVLENALHALGEEVCNPRLLDVTHVGIVKSFAREERVVPSGESSRPHYRRVQQATAVN